MPGTRLPARFDETTEIVVIGCGYAGAVAAIAAHDAGARVLVLEKMPDPGGISICSAGGKCSTGGRIAGLRAAALPCLD